MNNISQFTIEERDTIVDYLSSDFHSKQQCLQCLTHIDNADVMTFFKLILKGSTILSDDDGLMDFYCFEMYKFNERQRHLIKWGKRFHRHVFKTQISKDIITAAMHPCRIQAQIDQCDDIESYFEMMGC